MAEKNNNEFLDLWNVSEKVSEVSEQDIQQITENLKKAKQIRKQLNEQKKKDFEIAQILTLILKFLDDRNLLLKAISFYKKKIENIYFLFFLILPFIKEEIQLEDFSELMKEYWLKNLDITSISDYVSYVKNINTSGFDIQKEELVELVLDLIIYFRVGVLKDIDLKSNKGNIIKDLEENLRQEFKF